MRASSFYWAHQPFMPHPPLDPLSTRTDLSLDGDAVAWPEAISCMPHICGLGIWSLADISGLQRYFCPNSRNCFSPFCSFFFFLLFSVFNSSEQSELRIYLPLLENTSTRADLEGFNSSPSSTTDCRWFWRSHLNSLSFYNLIYKMGHIIDCARNT